MVLRRLLLRETSTVQTAAVKDDGGRWDSRIWCLLELRWLRNADGDGGGCRGGGD
ncbi:hypothetical protein DEO72_LG9g1874 [Vigna unguiculata]|uniref:Uncharacterized protein n=1 Tax=Vigna unguiculata TaxID=3917 RepID=A0A4D6MZ67_VIGUN|nr:hypothetical protein DEO72_LG9g1874 [Vigna unguiculata]